MRVDQIALQLYTVRERTAADMVGTLGEVAKMGYRAVEFAGYGGVKPAELRAALDGLGLRAIAAHVPYDRFDAEVARVVDEVRTLGAEYAVVPFLAEERRGKADETRRLAAAFNRWGMQCRDAGLGFAYHNHAFEFDPLPGEGGKTMLDLLLAETDPTLVGLELDVYWAVYAGVDPVALLRRAGARVPLLHMKDMAGGDDRRDAPVGAGTIDWPPILAAAGASTRWYIAEQDHPQDALADVETSLRGLEALATTG